jgi:hypothetical protein
MVFKRVGVASQQELLDRLSNTDPPAAADPEFSSTSP